MCLHLYHRGLSPCHADLLMVTYHFLGITIGLLDDEQAFYK